MQKYFNLYKSEMLNIQMANGMITVKKKKKKLNKIATRATPYSKHGAPIHIHFYYIFNCWRQGNLSAKLYKCMKKWILSMEEKCYQVKGTCQIFNVAYMYSTRTRLRRLKTKVRQYWRLIHHINYINRGTKLRTSNLPLAKPQGNNYHLC